MTMRLLVGRLTPAIRAKSVTPCGGRPPRPAARVSRVPCRLENATNVKRHRLPCPLRPGIAAQSPTGYLRLINGFQTLSSTSAGDFFTSADRPRHSADPLRCRGPAPDAAG